MPFTTSHAQRVTQISNPAISGSYSMVTGIVIPASTSRYTAYIQVVGTGSPLFVNFGLPASNSGVALILAPASVEFGADGGVLVENNFVGDIYISGNNKFIAWQTL